MLGLAPHVRLLVFAGRAAREKNVETMLDAVARLGPDHHLLLIGAGAFSKPQANASFLDFQRDPREVARLLASCDAFLHANPNEPFGLVALEAMASGLPIVGVASGGVSEMADESVGVLAPRATAACLAEAVEALFRRDIQALGAAARARVEARYGWDAVFTALTDVYERIAGPAPISAEIVPLQPRMH